MNDIQTKDEVVNGLKVKLTRFKTISEKKSSVVKSLKEVKERLVYDNNMRKEVEAHKEEKIEELEKIIDEGKRSVISAISESKNDKKICKELQKEKLTLEKNLDELKVAHGVLGKEKNNKDIELQSKNFLLKEKIALLVRNGIVEEDVAVVAEVRTETSNIRMNKNTSGSLCLICDREFLTDQDLEKHMEDKHDKSAQCPSCKNNFTKDALKQHTKKGKCKAKEVHFVCTDCKMKCTSEDDLMSHKMNDHDDRRSRQVCRHYRRGTCLRGDMCPYAHVGHQDLIQDNSHVTHKTNTARPCRNGDDCVWKSRGRCNYFHEGVGVQTPRSAPLAPQPTSLAPRQQPGPWPQQLRPQADPLLCPRGASCIHLARGTCVFGGSNYHRQTKEQQVQGERQQEQICWFGERCRRNPCPFSHQSLEDFPNLTRPVRPQILRTNQNNMRVNQNNVRMNQNYMMMN